MRTMKVQERRKVIERYCFACREVAWGENWHTIPGCDVGRARIVRAERKG